MINEKAIKPANFMWSLYPLIMLGTLLLRLTTFHYTSLVTTIVDTSLPPIQTSPNYTSLHVTTLVDTSLPPI